jgi:hypothetical protein
MMKKIANVIMVAALVGLVSQSAMANPQHDLVPDAGAASALLVIVIGGLAAARRFLR